MEVQAVDRHPHDRGEIGPNLTVPVIVVTVNTSDDCQSGEIPEQGCSENLSNERTPNFEETLPIALNVSEPNKDAHVIDIKQDGLEKNGFSSTDLEKERACRICHLTSEHHNSSEVMSLVVNAKMTLVLLIDTVRKLGLKSKATRIVKFVASLQKISWVLETGGF